MGYKVGNKTPNKYYVKENICQETTIRQHTKRLIGIHQELNDAMNQM